MFGWLLGSWSAGWSVVEALAIAFSVAGLAWLILGGWVERRQGRLMTDRADGGISHARGSRRTRLKAVFGLAVLLLALAAVGLTFGGISVVEYGIFALVLVGTVLVLTRRRLAGRRDR